VAEAIPLVAPPVWLSRTPPRIGQRAPTAGEHTAEVLHELGYTGHAVAEMREKGIV
jgi:formyl-CoA transferase